MRYPNNETLTEVFNGIVLNCKTLDDNHAILDIVGRGSVKINVFELMHKCKKWVNTIGWHIESSTDWCGDGKPWAKPVFNNGCEHEMHEEETEAESVFITTEWININRIK